MARLLPTIGPIAQMGQKVATQGLTKSPESGFFGREFTAKDLGDVFDLTQQGVNLIKEAEPIADYFSRMSKEADKQKALKEIADRRKKINAQKAAQSKLQRELGQQTAENRQLMGTMPTMSDVTLQEPAFGSSLAEPQPISFIGRTDAPDPEKAQLLRDAGLEGMVKDLPLTTSSVPGLSVDMPGAVDPSAMLQDMTAQRQAAATGRQEAQRQRLMQAAQRRVGAGPRGSQRLSDGTYRDPVDPNLVAAYQSLEESTGLPLVQMYAGSMPRYTPGTPDPVLPSEEALERLDARDLNTYRNLVRTPQEAALFNRLMDAAIKREGSGFMKEFTTQDALRKELVKTFDFAAGQKPRKLDSGGFDIGEIRKARKDFIKANKGKGAKIKGRVKMPKSTEDLIANGVIAIERGTYQDGDNVVTSENAVTSPAYARYLQSLSEQGDSRPGLTKMFMRMAKRDEKGRRYVMDRLGITGQDAAYYEDSMRVIQRRLAIWEKVTDKQINDAKRNAKLSATTKPGTIIRGTQGEKRIIQGDKKIDQGQQLIDERIRSNKVNEELRERGVSATELDVASKIQDRLDRAENRKDQLKIREAMLGIASAKNQLARERYNKDVTTTIVRHAIREADSRTRGEADERYGERWAVEFEKALENRKRSFQEDRTGMTIPKVTTSPGGKPTSKVRVLRSKANTGRND